MVGRFACLVLIGLAMRPAAAREIVLGGGMRLSQRGAAVWLVVRGARVRLSLEEDCPGCRLQFARLVATPPGGAVIIRATYASRPATPRGQCGAGEEEVLHVMVRHPALAEAVAWRLASCWRSIEPSEAGLTWDAPAARLSADRIVYQADAAWRERRAWRLSPDGGVREEGSLRRDAIP